MNPTGEANEFVLFIEALSQRLRQRKDYEVVQAWMAVFLKIHGEVLTNHVDTMRALEGWKQVQELESRRITSMVNYCSGVVSFLRSAR